MYHKNVIKILQIKMAAITLRGIEVIFKILRKCYVFLIVLFEDKLITILHHLGINFVPIALFEIDKNHSKV